MLYYATLCYTILCYDIFIICTIFNYFTTVPSIGIYAVQHERPGDGVGYVCRPQCMDRCIRLWVEEIADSLRIPFEGNLTEYLCCYADTATPSTTAGATTAGTTTGITFYSRPMALKDTQKRKALRMALSAAKVSSHSTAHTLVHYYTLLYYTILYYTILYYTILYYTILYYTIR
jgi:hypothetical protein